MRTTSLILLAALASASADDLPLSVSLSVSTKAAKEPSAAKSSKAVVDAKAEKIQVEAKAAKEASMPKAKKEKSSGSVSAKATKVMGTDSAKAAKAESSSAKATKAKDSKAEKASSVKTKSAKTESEKGATKYPLNGVREDVRTRPTNLGRLVSNSLTPPADKYLADIVGTEDRVDVCIMNSGGIRASIEGPSITQLDIDKALPFNHEVVVVKVTANQFLAAMENSVCVYPSTASEMVSGRYLQMVGAEMEFDASKSGVCNATELDEGSRVRYLKVFGKGVIVENGALVNEEQEFVLATNSYLASGGDEYSSLAAAAFLGNTGLGQQHVLWDDIMGRLGGHVDIKDPPESLSVTCIGGDCL